MQIKFGDYKIRAHELDQKLTVQVTSELGEVHIKETGTREFDFPNGVCHFVDNASAKIEPKGLKRYSFGEYTFILGINNTGELFLFHSVQLRVGKKLIDGIDTINLSFLKDPTS